MIDLAIDSPADCIGYDPRLAHVDCMIEADYDAHHKLWGMFSSGSRSRSGAGLEWKEDSLGKTTCIGKVGEQPVCVTWFFAVVSGVVVCFYSICSAVIDPDMARRWADAICSRHIATETFLFDIMSIPPTDTSGYEAACETLRQQTRERYEAKAAADAARRAAMTREPEVLAMIEAGIPDIDDGTLADRAAAIAPLVDRDGVLWHIEPGADLRGVSFTWLDTFTRPAEDLAPAKKVHTLHTFAYYGFFKPTIAEVLAQAPPDLCEYVAFSIKGPDDAVEMSLYPEATNAGYHVATVTYYRRA